MQAQQQLPLSMDGYVITIDAFELNNATHGKTVRMEWSEYAIAGFFFGAGFLAFTILAGLVAVLLLGWTGFNVYLAPW